MLTSDLVRVRLPRGGIIAPTFIKPNSKDLLETAEILVGLLNDALAEGWTKGQVDQAITEAIGDRRDQKLIRGVAKIILDRCTFEVARRLAYRRSSRPCNLRHRDARRGPVDEHGPERPGCRAVRRPSG
jgi:predicted nuclease of restriction endonuclease-like RecB superfamily